MARETLLSAARRVNRDMGINLSQDGGIVTEATQKSLLTMSIQVDIARKHEARAALIAASGDGAAALALLAEIFDLQDAAARAA